jgi:rhodanese-related sulfurtransferase/sulfur relay (sulfurtransferase) complex TusBCD TusD component (DsrE family)
MMKRFRSKRSELFVHKKQNIKQQHHQIIRRIAMCSTSKVNDMLGNLKGSSPPSIASVSGGGGSIVSATKLRQNRDSFFVVDVREAGEEPLAGDVVADANMTVGAILKDASSLTTLNPSQKQIVTVCATGVRAKVALEHGLVPQGFSNALVLQRGILGLSHAAACIPNFVVVLSNGESTEKLSLSLAACANAVETYDTVVLVLMSDAVSCFLKPESSFTQKDSTMLQVDSVIQGEPFKPCSKMLEKFLSKGGTVIACTTCVKHRGYSFETDMMDCANAMQMPDLVRMLGEAKGSLQFT